MRFNRHVIGDDHLLSGLLANGDPVKISIVRQCEYLDVSVE